MSKYISITAAAKEFGISRPTIYRYMKSGAISTEKQGARDLVSQVDLKRLLLGDTRQPTDPCRVIAIANQKGGAGKTTTAANTAAALARRGYHVLAIDCDPQGSLTYALGVHPLKELTTGLYHVLIGEKTIQDVVLTPIMDEPRLSLVGANVLLSGAERELYNDIGQYTKLRKALAPCLALYDFILLDCPPALGLLPLNALNAAGELIIPVDVGPFTLLGVGQLLKTVEQVQEVNPKLTRVYALSNRVDHTVMAREVREQLQEKFGEGLLKTVIRDRAKITEAQGQRLPVIVYSPNSEPAQDYFELVKELTANAT
jgi:chromosome partitioning protein